MPWTNDDAQLPTPTMATRIELIDAPRVMGLLIESRDGQPFDHSHRFRRAPARVRPRGRGVRRSRRHHRRPHPLETSRARAYAGRRRPASVRSVAGSPQTAAARPYLWKNRHVARATRTCRGLGTRAPVAERKQEQWLIPKERPSTPVSYTHLRA